ncbi:unnamed protein product, partial [Timema podura]|nr:unnamed protein product [Timema podura]
MSDQELTQAEEERVSLSLQTDDIRKEISTTSRRITHLGGLITDVLVVTPLEKIAELIMQEGSLEDLVLIVNGAVHSFMEAYPDNPDFTTDEAKFIKNLMRLITILGEDERGGTFAAESRYYLAMCFEYCKLLPKIPKEGLEFRRWE